MKYLKIIFIIVVALFYSCETENKYDDKSPLSEFERIEKVINSELKVWKEYSQNINQEFSLESFKLDTTRELSLNIVRELLKGDNSLESEYYYNYSPDSTRVLEIYGFVAGLDSVNGSIEVMFDVDTEALLIDLKESKAYRLLFFGPTVYLDDVAWINDSSFIIVGYSEITNSGIENSQLYQPIIWYFNLNDKQIKIYKSPILVAKAKLNYYKVKFPNFTI